MNQITIGEFSEWLPNNHYGTDHPINLAIDFLQFMDEGTDLEKATLKQVKEGFNKFCDSLTHDIILETGLSPEEILDDMLKSEFWEYHHLHWLFEDIEEIIQTKFQPQNMFALALKKIEDLTEHDDEFDLSSFLKKTYSIY